MRITIDLPDIYAADFEAKAKEHGMSVEEYASEVLQRDLAPDWLKLAWADAKVRGLDTITDEEIDAEIAAARKELRESRLKSAS